MKPNPGFCPAEAEGKRVRVRLANGAEFTAAASGRGACHWTRTGDPADITKDQVIA